MDGDTAAAHDPIGVGIEAGIIRCTEAGFKADRSLLAEAEDMLRDVVGDTSEPSHLVLNLLGEVVAVAVTARATNDESNLRPDELEVFIDSMRRIVNSAWHQPGM